jgi:hypothetical protein
MWLNTDNFSDGFVLGYEVSKIIRQKLILL